MLNQNPATNLSPSEAIPCQAGVGDIGSAVREWPRAPQFDFWRVVAGGVYSQTLKSVLALQELIYKEFFSQGDLVCGVRAGRGLLPGAVRG